MAGSGLLAHGVPANQPAFLRIIKYVVLLFSLLVLAMAAWSLSIFGQYSYYLGAGSGGLLIFVAIKTFIIIGVALYLEIAAPQHFYRIIMLIAYTISIIFWLSAWAWSASLAGLWLSAANDYCTYDENFNYSCSDFTPYKNEGSALAAAAAIGALTWVLLIVHLVFFVIACLRDPQGAVAGPQQAELGQVKAQEAYPAQQPYPQQPAPAQQYQQQPTYAEQPQHQQPYQQAYPTQ